MGSSTVRLLLVEDDPDDARVVERLLARFGGPGGDPDRETAVEIESVEHVTRLADALDRVDAQPIDLVLLDLGLPDSSGLETIDPVVERAPTTPVVVLTDRTDTGVAAIRGGAQDYLVKGTITAELLRRTMHYAIERARITRELRDRNHRLAVANEIVRTDLRDDLSVIVGTGDQLRERASGDDRRIAESLLAASRDALDLTRTAGELTDVLSGDAVADHDPVDLRTVLEPHLERLRDDPDVALTVEWRVPGDVPVTVTGSPTLGSAFDQLLSNAITHTDRETAAVDVSVTATDERVSVSIADDGVGLSGARKAAVADPDGTAPERGVIGAGLYLVRTVIGGVGGDIEIADRDPRGTVVSVSLERV